MNYLHETSWKAFRLLFDFCELSFPLARFDPLETKQRHLPENCYARNRLIHPLFSCVACSGGQTYLVSSNPAQTHNGEPYGPADHMGELT